MQDTREIFKGIIEEIEPVLSRMNQEEMEAAVKAICEAKRIFIAGIGRSGNIMRCFGMRLMQMGFTTFIVGDTVTPSAFRGRRNGIPHNKGLYEESKTAGV